MRRQRRNTTTKKQGPPAVWWLVYSLVVVCHSLTSILLPNYLFIRVYLLGAQSFSNMQVSLVKVWITQTGPYYMALLSPCLEYDFNCVFICVLLLYRQVQLLVNYKPMDKHLITVGFAWFGLVCALHLVIKWVVCPLLYYWFIF